MPFDFNGFPFSIHNLAPQTSLWLECSIYSFCQMSCVYCFSNLDRKVHDHELNLVNPTQKVVNALERAMADPESPEGFFLREKQAIVYSNRTDGFQREEKTYRASLAFLKWAKTRDVPIFLQTKGNVLHEELDTYLPYLDPGRVAVYFSLCQQDEATRRQIEPGALSIPKRWELIRRLSDHGLPVIAACNPFVPEWVPDKAAYVAQAKEAGCRAIIADPLHLTAKQIPHVPTSYTHRLVAKANLQEVYVGRHLRQWSDLCREAGLDFFATSTWARHLPRRPRFYAACDPAWVGGRLFDFTYQILSLAAQASEEAGGALVMWSWPDVRAYLEASGVPNPVLKTQPFWLPYNSAIKADRACWTAKLGRRAPFYDILRYWLNHPWETESFFWSHPFVQALWDAEKELYVADSDGDLICVYNPAMQHGAPFTHDRSAVNWDRVIWLSMPAPNAEAEAELELDAPA